VGAAIDNVAAKGVSYFSSAGNSNKRFLVEPANFVTPPSELSGLTGSTCRLWHKFEFSTTTFFPILFPISFSSDGLVGLFWDAPYASTTFDYPQLTLFLFDISSRVIGRSQDFNPGTKIPVQGLLLSSIFSRLPGLTLGVCWSGTGTPPRTLVLGRADNALLPSTYKINPSLQGHVLARGCLAVAAVNCETGVLEAFSSPGPSLLKYDVNSVEIQQCTGDAINSLSLKPDITGCDGVVTSFFGGPTNRFFGTSAAAPNAAAVAGLVLEQARRDGRSLFPHEVAEILKRTTNQQGVFDNTMGFGLVDATSAVDLLSSFSSPTLSSLPDAPAGLRATGRQVSNGQSSVIFSWLPPCDGGAVIQSYVIRISAIDNSSSPLEVTTGDDSVTISIARLNDQSFYTAQVAAMNAIGSSIFSTATSFSPSSLGTPPQLNLPPSGTSSSSSFPLAAIIGIAVGGVVLIAIIVLVIVGLSVRARRRPAAGAAAPGVVLMAPPSPQQAPVYFGEPVMNPVVPSAPPMSAAVYMQQTGPPQERSVIHL